jgi:cytochrome c556
MRKLFTVIAMTGIFLSGIAYADVIEDRQAIMKEKNGASMGVLGKIAKGEMAFDADAVMNAFVTMREGTEGFAELFPEGTQTGGDTTASPAIWSDMEGFRDQLAEFHADLDAAIAAEPANMEEFMPVFQEVAGNCQDCHQDYRVKKD